MKGPNKGLAGWRRRWSMWRAQSKKKGERGLCAVCNSFKEIRVRADVCLTQDFVYGSVSESRLEGFILSEAVSDTKQPLQANVPR